MTVGARDREALRCRSADRDIALIKRATAPATSEALRQYTGIEGLPDQRVTVYLLVDPTAADQAEARVTGLLGTGVQRGASELTSTVNWRLIWSGPPSQSPPSSSR